MTYRLLAARHRRPVDALDRRQVLEGSLAIAAGLFASCAATRAARGMQPERRAVVVGAGFAGLACAFELSRAGWDVVVLEARRRVGGRVLTFGDFVPGRHVEGGAELIGSNHPLWMGYMRRFRLRPLDVPTEDDLDFPICLDGRRLAFEESARIWEEIEAAQAALTAMAAEVVADEPWTSPSASELDARSLGDWLREAGLSPLAARALDAELASNNGVALERQSLLAMLACIQGGGGEAYWTESEVYRCEGGNQRLAQCLAAELGARVHLNAPVERIDLDGDHARVSSADGRSFEGDAVVLATPPPTWSRIAITPALPTTLAPQMGTNVKFLSHVRQRFWRGAENKVSQYALTDGEAAMTWDATAGQAGRDACLTAFAGGSAADRARARSFEERLQRYASELEACFPGYEANRIATRFMDWPSEPRTGAGYAFPAPGQVTTLGPLLASPHHGRLHLAGEHCCIPFVGYMEGALQSGVAVARRLCGERSAVPMR